MKMREIAISKDGVRDSVPIPEISTPANFQTVDESSRPNSKGG
jgi:hypothetical protein